jgi:hypothetical protein
MLSCLNSSFKLSFVFARRFSFFQALVFAGSTEGRDMPEEELDLANSPLRVRLKLPKESCLK